VTKKGAADAAPFFVLRGDPNNAKFELGCGVPHRLGGAPDARGLSSGDSEADPDEPPQAGAQTKEP